MKEFRSPEVISDRNTEHAGSLLTGMNEDSVMLEQAMGEKVGTFLFNMGMFASGLTVAFIYGWDLTLLMMAILPLLGGSVALLFKVRSLTLPPVHSHSHSLSLSLPPSG